MQDVTVPHHGDAARISKMRPHVGQTARRSLTLTQDHVETFARLTGDYNPLHFDADFA
jgi:acyl dehydratase